MPAHVDFRLGSIFDEPCDLLVIPSSAGGTVMPEIQQEIRKAELPFPGAMTRGQVSLLPSGNPKFRAVAYAATVAGQSTSDLTVEAIGRQLGVIAKERGYLKISAPLLGAGSGDLPAPIAAATLARGFQSTAPKSAELWISVRDPGTLKAVAARLLGLLPHDQTVREATRTSSIATPLASRAGEVPIEKVRAHIESQIARSEVPAHAALPTRSTPATDRRRGVFISYSRKDIRWLERLEPHLAHLHDEELVWSDKDIEPGADWQDEIQSILASCKVAVLLISANFLASRFIRENELPPLLEAADKEGAAILPVHLSASRFDLIPELSRFQSANDPKQPLMKFRGNRLQEEMDRIARAVEDALKR